MGIRGYKATPGTNRLFYMAELLRSPPEAVCFSFNSSHLKGPGQSFLCLLRLRAAVHPSVPQHQPAANGPEGHRPLHL